MPNKLILAEPPRTAGPVQDWRIEDRFFSVRFEKTQCEGVLYFIFLYTDSVIQKPITK